MEGCGSTEAREVSEGFLEEVLLGSPGQGWREFQRTTGKETRVSWAHLPGLTYPAQELSFLRPVGTGPPHSGAQGRREACFPRPRVGSRPAAACSPQSLKGKGKEGRLSTHPPPRFLHLQESREGHAGELSASFLSCQVG